MRRVLLSMAAALLWLGALPAAGQAEPLALDAASIRGGALVALDDGWRFAAGDSARPPADLAAAVPVGTHLRRGGVPDGWDGDGWFVRDLAVPEGLVGVPAAFVFFHRGVVTVWVDGAELGQRGNAVGDDWTRPPATLPLPHTFERAGVHRLAVHFRNPALADHHRAGSLAGFTARFGTAEAVAATRLAEVKRDSMMLWLFTGIFVSFGVLHLCLWGFQRAATENLWFAGLCLANASLVCFLFLKTLVDSPGLPLVSEPVMNLSGLAWGLFAVRFVYGVFHDRLPRWRLVAGLAAAVVVAAWSLADTSGALPFVFLFMFASCLEMIRVVVVAIWRRRPGAWLIGCGLLALALGFGVALVRNLGWIPRDAIPGGNLIPFGSMVLLIGSMSLYLADAFARANRELRRQLVEVERLSAERLEQERRAQRQETERRLLEAEVRRKSEELEEARALQMSMLPSVVPERDGLEIATHIAPATEVGGDYYDFAGDDGGLVVAIGDATGHGMRAGTMVTATKALFGLLGRVDLKAELAASNRALKRMNLKRLAMAFTLARFEPGLCRVSAAGMPPVLLRRAAGGEVESIELGGTPLGSLPGFPYRQAETATAPGDLVLFMSDGLPELLDPDGEEVGYERVERLLAETKAATAQELVDELVDFAAGWRRERPPDDDLTFVAVRIV